MGKTVSLSPGTHVLVRDPGHIQFGLDATRSGVLATPHAETLAAVLTRLRSPVSVSALADEIVARTGATPAHAASLIDELLDFRILASPTRHNVLVLGQSPAAKALTGVAGDAGLSARRTLRGETDAEFLAAADATAVAVLVDKLAQARSLSLLLAGSGRSVLPVTVIDQRVVVGPAAPAGAGPCILCLQLEFTDVDGAWSTTTTRVPVGLPRPDPTVVAAGTAAAVVMLRRMLGAGIPPGLPATPPVPGETVTVDPFCWPAVTRRVMDSHPHCPVCTGAIHVHGEAD